ncbi:MAG: tetratricopeptide repeat protein [Beijerinckiaceae bacterium]|nr:tetratricopeptide repeat protein [Beijerinckiaceae bacterium]MCZ8299005.1 tetratricopeptide repeat protein [Beijerinckiaceae bacterium]
MKKMTDILLRAQSFLDRGDNIRAFNLFMEAAREGKTASYNTIGYMLDHGIGVAKDEEAAFRWYKKAARAGDCVSYNNIGIYYYNKKNINLAKKWLMRSINNKYHGSALFLSRIYMNDLKNIRLAKKYANIVLNSDYVSSFDKEEANKLLGKIKSIKKPV